MATLLIIVLPICLATSFICAGMEAGIFTLGRWRIAQQMRSGQIRAARLYAYLQNTENFLWTVLVGNTLAFFGAMWIVGVKLIRELAGEDLFFWLAYLAAAFIFYALCDLLPKTLFRKFPNRLCLVLSAPFRLLHFVLSPIVALIEGVTGLLLRWTGGRTYKGDVFSNRDELRFLMENTAQVLTTEERGMMSRVFDLHNIAVRQIAIPFARVPNLDADQPLAEALARFRSIPQNLLPVWHGAGRERKIAGFLELKRLLFQSNPPEKDPLARHLSRPLYMDENMRVHDALRRLQRAGQRMAVVLARDGREIGLITLEDILKVVFGEVRL